MSLYYSKIKRAASKLKRLFLFEVFFQLIF